MSCDVSNLARRAITTAAGLLEGLTAEEKDELRERLAHRGYKPELAVSVRKASTPESGGVVAAANAYRLFNAIGADVGGPGLLKALRRPCCGLPDRSWLDPNTGSPIERAITFGHWRPDYEVTVAYRFSRTPDAGDVITAAEIRSCFEAALACWMSVSGIRLRLIDDFNRANIQVVDASIDRQHGVLADMYLPGPGAVAAGHVCKGRFDWNEDWGLRTPTRPLGPRAIDFLNVLIHELGHAWGMDHEPGNGQEVLNPMYWPAPHLFSDGRHWIGAKDTATMRRVYGEPKVGPTPVPPPPPPPPPTPPSGPRPSRVRLTGIYAGDRKVVNGNVQTLNGGIFTGAVEEVV